MIHTDAGYYTPVTAQGGSGVSYSHIWYLKDHLGNNRVLADGSGNALKNHHYDPYGMEISVSSTPGFPSTFPSGSTESPYKYGGKEWNETTSTYDFEARYLSPAFHRFTTMDPLAEKYYSISPYAYCAGDPVNLVDPEGRGPVVGALIGAGLDIGIQITTNLFTGEKWYRIDGKSVVISTVAGAAGAGIMSKAKQAYNLAKNGESSRNGY